MSNVEYQGMKAKMVERTNAHTDAMRGMSEETAFGYVRSLIDDSQIVFGVYQDASEPDGVGMHLIKGNRELQAVRVSGTPEALRTEAVPCISLEQEVVAERMLGNGAHKSN